MPSPPNSPSNSSPSRLTSDLLALSAQALLLQVVAQWIVGAGLGLGYRATLASAYASDGAMRTTALGGLAASFHYWGSALLIVHSGLHLLAMLFTLAFRRSSVAWYGSIALFLGAFGLQLTGNLLPMDRHGVQTAVVEGGIAGSLPVLGPSAHNLMLDGKQFSQSTLSSWFFQHSWLLPVLVLAASICLVVGSNRENSRANEVHRPSRWPSAIPILLLAMVAISVPAPRGNQAGVDDYQSYGALVSWYTWPLHGLLSAAEKINPSCGWLGFAVWPGITVLFLVLLPILAKRLTNTTVFGISALLLVPYPVLGLLYGGPIASLVGNRDPAMPKVDSAPFPKPVAERPSAATLATGKSLFNSSGCSDCHGKDGANGDSGPNLTRAYLKHPDAAYFKKYIHNPKSVDPASTMPAFPDLADGDLEKISLWLSTAPDAAPGSAAAASVKP